MSTDSNSGQRGEPVDRSVILPLLGFDLVREGQWLMTWCPAHNDGAKHGRKPGRLDGRSLGLSDKGHLKCMAGCTFKALAEALGIPKSNEDAADAPRPAAVPMSKAKTELKLKPGARIVATYSYKDADGKEVAVKVRIENPDGGKEFRWREPRSSLYGIDTSMEEMPLWGAELVATANPKEWVIFCEGEKATEAVRQRGFLAVTHGGGASQQRFNGTLDILRDRRVALWPDNDEPGRRYMSRIAKLLGPIARQVRYITVPQGPKEDAFDYFAKGGKPEDVFKTVWDQPLVEFLGDDHVRVTTFGTHGPVLWDFDEMLHERGELSCELTITLLTPGQEEEPYALRINMLSSSSRESLERQLKKQFSGEWTQATSQAFSRAREAYSSQERGKQFGCIVDKPVIYLLDPWIPRGQHTILFGDGSSGKTMWCYALALAIAIGSPCWGSTTDQTGVMIVDYETNGETAKKRMRRLLKGMGFSESMLEQLNIHYWPAGGVPLEEQTDAIRRYAKAHDIGLMIVDSGGVATADAPETSRGALRYFAAASKCGIETTITICHVSGMSDGMYPFGSRYWHNLARRTYFMKASGIGTDCINIAFHPRKANEAKLPPSTSFQMEFAKGDDGPISIGVGALRQVSPYRDDPEFLDSVWERVQRNPGIKQWELAKELMGQGVDRDDVNFILYTYTRSFEFKTEPSSNGGAVRAWYATAERPSDYLAS